MYREITPRKNQNVLNLVKFELKIEILPYICDKCQKVVNSMFIYGTFVTCFTSYLGKSREKSDNYPITLFISYSTHLCMN